MMRQRGRRWSPSRLASFAVWTTRRLVYDCAASSSFKV